MRWFLVLIAVCVSALAAQPTSRPTTQAAESFTYRGRQVSVKWVQAKYDEYRDKLAFVDGKMVDVGTPDSNGIFIRNEAPPKGTVCKTLPLVVKRIGNKGDIICQQPGARGIGLPADYQDPSYLHITGVDTSQLSPGSILSVPLIANGIDPGTHLQSYIAANPPTFEQFTDSLANGYVLTERRVTTDRKGNRHVVETPVR